MLGGQNNVVATPHLVHLSCNLLVLGLQYATILELITLLLHIDTVAIYPKETWAWKQQSKIFLPITSDSGL